MHALGRLCRTAAARRAAAGSSSSSSSRRRLASQPARERLEDIGVIRAYGKPVATLFLWSALAYMSLQAVWSKLYYDEVRLETEARIDSLQDELRTLQQDRPR